VERHHRNLNDECLLLERPQDLQSTQEVNQHDAWLYNFERPSQALTCQNQPPKVAFPETPLLPNLPEVVTPENWLRKIHGKSYKRRIDHNGCVQIGKQLKGRDVILGVDALKREFLSILICSCYSKNQERNLEKESGEWSKFSNAPDLMSVSACSKIGN
jgi:hypothetical protein